MPTMAERIWWGQGNGDSLHAVQTEAGRVGALICWEHWMPLTRTALHATSEDIHVAAWPRVSVNAIFSLSFCWALSKHFLRHAFCQATSLFTHGVREPLPMLCSPAHFKACAAQAVWGTDSWHFRWCAGHGDEPACEPALCGGGALLCDRGGRAAAQA
jgi:hypothetical protein